MRHSHINGDPLDPFFAAGSLVETAPNGGTRPYIVSVPNRFYFVTTGNFDGNTRLSAPDLLRYRAEHDPSRFIADAANDIDGTESKQSDEESSGIVEVTEMFNKVEGYDTDNFRYFLLDVQAHYPL
jgi:hypothetical protein